MTDTLVIVLECACVYVLYPLMATLASTAKSVLLDTLGLVLSNWLELKGIQVKVTERGPSSERPSDSPT